MRSASIPCSKVRQSAANHLRVYTDMQHCTKDFFLFCWIISLLFGLARVFHPVRGNFREPSYARTAQSKPTIRPITSTRMSASGPKLRFGDRGATDHFAPAMRSSTPPALVPGSGQSAIRMVTSGTRHRGVPPCAKTPSTFRSASSRRKLGPPHSARSRTRLARLPQDDRERSGFCSGGSGTCRRSLQHGSRGHARALCWPCRLHRRRPTGLGRLRTLRQPLGCNAAAL